MVRRDRGKCTWLVLPVITNFRVCFFSNAVHKTMLHVKENKEYGVVVRLDTSKKRCNEVLKELIKLPEFEKKITSNFIDVFLKAPYHQNELALINEGKFSKLPYTYKNIVINSFKSQSNRKYMTSKLLSIPTELTKLADKLGVDKSELNGEVISILEDWEYYTEETKKEEIIKKEIEVIIINDNKKKS